MIDPHFSRPGLMKLLHKIEPDKAKVRSGLRKLDATVLNGVLLTHTHYDHAMDAAEVVHQSGGALYGSESAANLAIGAGLSKRQYRVVMPQEQVTIGTLKVTWLNSRHISFPPPFSWFMPENGRINHPVSPPLYFWKYQSGSVYAILIEHLLVFGSAGFILNACQGYDAKAVVLSIGGLETRSFHYLEKLYQHTVIQTGAQKVLISHWDNFFLPISPKPHTLGLAKLTIQRLKRLGTQYGQTVEVLLPGEKIRI